MESSSKIFDGADVAACGIFASNYDAGVPPASFFCRWVTGHLLVTQTYLSPQATTATFTSRVASAAGRLRSNGIIGNWKLRFSR